MLAAHPDAYFQVFTNGQLISDAVARRLRQIGNATPLISIEGAEAVSMRQSPVYFPAGGGTIRGVSRPGEIVWSRLYIAEGGLHLDIGRGRAVKLPQEQTAGKRVGGW